MRFVHGTELTEAIHGALIGNKRDLAVAYFGAGAARRLGLIDATNARIVCDLWSGACNPVELQKLSDAGATLKNAPGLHAKVYIGTNRVVVASANASANGLGEEGTLIETGLEAGVIIEDALERARVEDWFERIFAKARKVTSKDLADLRSWWQMRPPPRRRREENFGGSLLQLAVSDPQAFQGVGFVFTKSENEAAAIEKLKKLGRKTDPERSEDISRWNKDDLFTEWDVSVIRKWPRHFIAYHLGGRGKIWVRAMRLDQAVETGDGLGGVFCKPAWAEIVHPVLPAYSQSRAEKEDAAMASELLKTMGDGQVFRTAVELANYIRALAE